MTKELMMSKSSDISSQGPPQGENVASPTLQPGPPEHLASRSRNPVFKSGPLFISSKGIGWTSWKKRWFILTRTSLVFFRSDPSQAPQKGGETNLTLGGIDLNNSASVEVKADKKLLTVLFPDGREGRAFTLKAETTEDLLEWKTALENALAQAPSATNNAGQNGVMKSEQADDSNGDADEKKDGPHGLSGKSMVLGRPILLALEDIDGSPSFLEKALRFIEDHGVRVEGVLRQAADVDEVYHRVHEYEQGKTEFSPDEDAHVIGDCIKYILRELPSSPVPASCCNALLEAFRTDRNNRVIAMRSAIQETFPEPNRRLLQRILQMMQIVASNKNVNRMSTSAVAACMSPLLLRPLLAGECDLGDTHMDMAGDSSFQLLQAAAAANHAQAIIIILLEEYNKIFGDGSMSDDELFSDSYESGSGSEEARDDDMYEDDDDDYLEDEDHEDASDDHEETDYDYEHSVAESYSGSGDDYGESDSNDDKHSERSTSFSKSPDDTQTFEASQRSLSTSPRSPESQHDHCVDGDFKRHNKGLVSSTDTVKLNCGTPAETSIIKELGPAPETGCQMSARVSQIRRQRWGRTSARKNLSMESIDFQLDEEDEIERLEAFKCELENRIEEEASGNSKLQASLERRKKALHERRLALEIDVSRLQEQLQTERDLRATLEAQSESDIAGMPEQMKIELQKIELAEGQFSNLKQRLDDIDNDLHHQHDETVALLDDRKIELLDSTSQGSNMSMFNEMRDELHHRGTSKNERQRNYKIEGDDHANDRTNQSLKKNQNQPSDVPRGGSSKLGWFSGTSSSMEASIPKPSPPNLRKSSTKGEGSSNTTSALSKLSTRLNFLKERRNQIANELQSMDKGRGLSTQPILSPGKGKGTEPSNNFEKSQGSSGSFLEKAEDRLHQPSHSFDKGSLNEADNNRDYVKMNDEYGNKKGSRKSEASSSQNEQHLNNIRDNDKMTDDQSGKKKGSRKPETSSHNEQHLDRLKSEGGQPSSRKSDESRQQDAKTSRTLSR